jgi:hypothetical protein
VQLFKVFDDLLQKTAVVRIVLVGPVMVIKLFRKPDRISDYGISTARGGRLIKDIPVASIQWVVSMSDY